jgi:hypothetical protein
MNEGGVSLISGMLLRHLLEQLGCVSLQRPRQHSCPRKKRIFSPHKLCIGKLVSNSKQYSVANVQVIFEL